MILLSTILTKTKKKFHFKTKKNVVKFFWKHTHNNRKRRLTLTARPQNPTASAPTTFFKVLQFLQRGVLLFVAKHFVPAALRVFRAFNVKFYKFALLFVDNFKLNSNPNKTTRGSINLKYTTHFLKKFNRRANYYAVVVFLLYNVLPAYVQNYWTVSGCFLIKKLTNTPITSANTPLCRNCRINKISSTRYYFSSKKSFAVKPLARLKTPAIKGNTFLSSSLCSSQHNLPYFSDSFLESNNFLYWVEAKQLRRGSVSYKGLKSTFYKNTTYGFYKPLTSAYCFFDNEEKKPIVEKNPFYDPIRPFYNPVTTPLPILELPGVKNPYSTINNWQHQYITPVTTPLPKYECPGAEDRYPTWEEWKERYPDGIVPEVRCPGAEPFEIPWSKKKIPTIGDRWRKKTPETLDEIVDKYIEDSWAKEEAEVSLVMGLSLHKNGTVIGLVDFETIECYGGILKPVCLGLAAGTARVVFTDLENKSMVSQFLEFVETVNADCVFFAHNLDFDARFFIPELDHMGITVSIVQANTKITAFGFHLHGKFIAFKCTYCLTKKSLKNLAKDMGTTAQKMPFPYKLLTEVEWWREVMVVAPVDFKSREEYDCFVERYGFLINLPEITIKYVKADLEVYAECFEILRAGYEAIGVDILTCPATLAEVCYEIFLAAGQAAAIPKETVRIEALALIPLYIRSEVYQPFFKNIDGGRIVSLDVMSISPVVSTIPIQISEFKRLTTKTIEPNNWYHIRFKYEGQYPPLPTNQIYGNGETDGCFRGEEILMFQKYGGEVLEVIDSYGSDAVYPVFESIETTIRAAYNLMPSTRWLYEEFATNFYELSGGFLRSSTPKEELLANPLIRATLTSAFNMAIFLKQMHVLALGGQLLWVNSRTLVIWIPFDQYEKLFLPTPDCPIVFSETPSLQDNKILETCAVTPWTYSMQLETGVHQKAPYLRDDRIPHDVFKHHAVTGESYFIKDRWSAVNVDDYRICCKYETVEIRFKHSYRRRKQAQYATIPYKVQVKVLAIPRYIPDWVSM